MPDGEASLQCLSPLYHCSGFFPWFFPQESLAGNEQKALVSALAVAGLPAQP